MDINWGDIISDVIGSFAEGGIQYGAGMLMQDAAEGVRDDDRAYAAEQSELDFQRRLELAGMAKGPKGPFLGFTDPQKVAAMQNQQKAHAGALRNIIESYQRMLGPSGGR